MRCERYNRLMPDLPRPWGHVFFRWDPCPTCIKSATDTLIRLTKKWLQLFSSSSHINPQLSSKKNSLDQQIRCFV